MTKPIATKSTNAAPKATKPKSGRVVYISKSKAEHEALLKLGFRERWLYDELKWLANFKTGLVGTFARQKLTYVDIAALVTAPGVQGRGQGGIDETQAADFLKRMEAVGLVANIGRRANGGLSFELPLSPIGAKPSGQVGQNTGQTAGEVQDISPADRSLQIAANAEPDWVSSTSDSSVSVVINTNLNINTDGVPPACAGSTLGHTHGVAPPLGKNATQPDADQPLTQAEIRAVFVNHWDYTGTDTERANALYVVWAEARITLADLHAAMTSLEEDPAEPERTPENLKHLLWDAELNHLFAL
jgi:hypothetical protein